MTFIENLLKRYRTDGTVEPRAHGGGQPAKLNPEQEAVLASLVEEDNDAILVELCDRLIKQAKQTDLDCLLWAHSTGEICLKFLDESGFSQWSPVRYSYAKVGNQKVLSQTTRRGRRLSILGLLGIGNSFEYGLKLGSFHRESYLGLIEWQAKKAAERLATAGQITVVVQDNHPIYMSKQVKEYWCDWQEKGLYLFQLPKYYLTNEFD